MKRKRITIAGGLFTLLLLLSGCVRTTKSGRPYGFVYDYMAKPMQHLMEWLASHMGNNYGWAIIVIVVVVRTILLPVMFSQMKKSTIMQEKMSKVQPLIKELTEKQKAAKTPEEQAAVSQQMMALYRDNNISLTGGIGCLPLLIQLPIFAALYAAIRYSPDLYHATFFGIPLGKPSIILAVLSFIAYAAQSYLGLVGVPEAQKKQMKAAIWMSPFMTLMVNAYRPRIRRQIEEESKKNPIKMPEAPVINTPSSSTKPTDAIDQLRKGDAKPSDKANRNRQRNAGKQQHHKK